MSASLGYSAECGVDIATLLETHTSVDRYEHAVVTVRPAAVLFKRYKYKNFPSSLVSLSKFINITLQYAIALFPLQAPTYREKMLPNIAVAIAIFAVYTCLAHADCTTTPPPDPTSSCTSTLCADYINSCGQTYGGCYPACSGYTTPSFTDPGCPTTTPAPQPNTTCTSTLCADYINSCGQTYGGCFPACPGYTTPSFTDPGCPTTTPMPEPTGCPQLCVDYINDCGRWYGGCFESCSGATTPSFTDPGCPTTSSTAASTLTTTTSGAY